MAGQSSSSAGGRPRVAPQWESKMRYTFLVSFANHRDVHTALFQAGVNAVDLIMAAVSEYVVNHNLPAGDAELQKRIVASALHGEIDPSRFVTQSVTPALQKPVERLARSEPVPPPATLVPTPVPAPAPAVPMSLPETQHQAPAPAVTDGGFAQAAAPVSERPMIREQMKPDSGAISSNKAFALSQLEDS